MCFWRTGENTSTKIVKTDVLEKIPAKRGYKEKHVADIDVTIQGDEIIKEIHTFYTPSINVTITTTNIPQDETVYKIIAEIKRLFTKTYTEA